MKTIIASMVAVLSTISVATPAAARELCPERPGQTTPPCTVEPGHAIAEMGLIDWQLEKDAAHRTDTVTIAQVAVRAGIADHAEVSIGWTPFATARTRDRATGMVDRQSGVGDVVLAIKRSLGKADAPVAAIKAYVSVPVGEAPAGGSGWSAGAQLPLSLPLSETVELAITPEIDVVADDDGRGHHAAYGGAAGVNLAMSNAFNLGADLRIVRDEAPGSAASQITAGSSLAYQPSETLQFDVGGTAGLNSTSPDLELYIGIAKRF